MVEINLKDLFNILLKRWWILALCSVVFATAAGLWSHYVLVPVYSANTTLYVGKNADNNSSLSGDLDLGDMLILDYQELAKSRLVSSKIIEELELSDFSPEKISSMIEISQKKETRILQIIVSDTNSQRAMDIANKVAEVLKEKVEQIMRIENVQVIDKAILPQFPTKPNKTMNTAIGFIFGMALGLGIVIFMEFLDDTLKTAEDVKEHLDMPVIGMIPSFQQRER